MSIYINIEIYPEIDIRQSISEAKQLSERLGGNVVARFKFDGVHVLVRGDSDIDFVRKNYEIDHSFLKGLHK